VAESHDEQRGTVCVCRLSGGVNQQDYGETKLQEGHSQSKIVPILKETPRDAAQTKAT